MQATRRPLLTELMKQASEETSRRVAAYEASLQRKHASGEECEEDDKKAKKGAEKTSSAADNSTDYLNKLASACEYAAGMVMKQASDVGPGHGPQALTVTESHNTSHLPGPGGQGHGTQLPPKDPPMQSSGVGPATQMQNDMNHRPGGHGHQEAALTAAKTAMAKVAARSGGVSSIRDKIAQAQKLAADADGTPRISTGKGGTEPETNISGDAIGPGQPLAGGAGGQASLVSSNDRARSYKPGEAYAPRKAELAKYFQEPAQSAAHDTTLSQAFAHTGEAGTKLSTDRTAQVTASLLLNKLAAAAASEGAR